MKNKQKRFGNAFAIFFIKPAMMIHAHAYSLK